MSTDPDDPSFADPTAAADATSSTGFWPVICERCVELGRYERGRGVFVVEVSLADSAFHPTGTA